jgi:hypothetical protein
VTDHDDPSGHALAEQAYDAGAVEPGERVHPCELMLTVRMVSGGDHARRLGEEAALEILSRSDVIGVDYEVVERE